MVLRRSLVILIAILLPASALAAEKYVVKKGDNLYDLSRKFGLTVDELKSTNNLEDNKLDIGDVLIIGVSVRDEDTTVQNTAHGNNNKYIVKNGDTLGEIAEKYGLSSDDLKTVNGLKNTKLQIGQKLLIPSSNPEPVKISDSQEQPAADPGNGKADKAQNSPENIPAETFEYTVRKGDTLGHIAERHNSSSKDLKEANGLKNDKLRIGQVLIIPGNAQPRTHVVAYATITPDAPEPANAGVYTVVKGDTPGGIAHKLGVGADDLIKLNNIDSKKLQIGQRLTVPGYVRQDTAAGTDDAASRESAEPKAAETAEVPSPSETRTGEYVIKKGDTPGGIAARLGVSTNELIRVNSLDSRKLRIGQVLVVPGTETSNIKEAADDETPDKQPAQDNPPSEYIVKKGDTLYVLSKTFGVPVETIKKYNKLKSNNLRIGQRLVLNPSATSVASGGTVEEEIVTETETAITESTKYTTRYTVRKGDTLGHLALRFGVPQSELRKANGLKNSSLRSGQVLMVPGTAATEETEEAVIRESVVMETAPEPASEVYIKKRYVVKPGDTLGNIAAGFGVTVEEIKKASALKKETINNGDILLIPVPQEKVTQSKYTVAKGDTLSKLSKKFGVSVREIKKANGLSSDRLRAGMRLSIPGSYSTESGAGEAENTAASSLPRGEYVVKKGDTLGRIARRYDVTIKQLKRENNIKGNSIRAGQVLYIPGYERQDTEYRAVTEKDTVVHESNGQYDYTEPDVENGRFSKESIIEVAKKYLGAPYKFGGNDLATGIDCSGYVKKIFSRFNVYLPRTARDIYYSSGYSIPKKKLDTGDLVFFTTYAKYPSHVGIYIGNDEFIHASSASRKVTIDSINKQYYKKRYIGAKRVQLSGLFYDELSKDYAGFGN